MERNERAEMSALLPTNYVAPSLSIDHTAPNETIIISDDEEDAAAAEPSENSDGTLASFGGILQENESTET